MSEPKRYADRPKLRTRSDSRSKSEPRKISIADCKVQRITRLLVYCENRAEYCSHSAKLIVENFPDHFTLDDVEQRCRCTACGKKKCDVRPEYPPALGQGGPRSGAPR